MDKELEELTEEFRKNFKAAPLYGGFSRNLKRKIESKQQVKMTFIEDLQMFGILAKGLNEDDVVTKVEAILKAME